MQRKSRQVRDVWIGPKSRSKGYRFQPLILTDRPNWRLLVHEAVQEKLYVTNKILVMPAFSKEDLEIDRKVLRKRNDLISQGI